MADLPPGTVRIEVSPPRLCRSLTAGSLVWVDEACTVLGHVVRVNESSLDVLAHARVEPDGRMTDLPALPDSSG